MKCHGKEVLKILFQVFVFLSSWWLHFDFLFYPQSHFRSTNKYFHRANVHEKYVTWSKLCWLQILKDHALEPEPAKGWVYDYSQLSYFWQHLLLLIIFRLFMLLKYFRSPVVCILCFYIYIRKHLKMAIYNTKWKQSQHFRHLQGMFP